MILKANDITMQFGGVTAVYKLNIEINDHEIIALIGPNGAGKTTAFNMITGVYTPTEGKVIYTDAQGQDIDITGQRPSEIAKLGIARTFQNIRLFKDLTVYENVLIANHLHFKIGFSFGNTASAVVYERSQTNAPQYRKTFAGSRLVGFAQRKGFEPALRPAAPPGNCPCTGHRHETAAP